MDQLMRIDGSFGEGGGQILRTSLAFSAILGRPVEIFNIRAKRENPGLRKQHIATIRAIAILSNGRVEGLREGASRIAFYPGKISNVSMKLDIGSAGSITLLLQAAIPASALSGATVEVEVSGGTDVRWSPTAEYFRRVALPAFRDLGVFAEMEVVKRGYYPEGGGLVKCKVAGGKGEPSPLNLLDCQIPDPSLVSVCSRLPSGVAERQISGALNLLSKEGVTVMEREVRVENSASPGTSMLAYSVSPNGPFIGGDSIGERGKRAERVGEEAAEMLLAAVRVRAPVDDHLADMVIPILAMAKGESEFMVSMVSQHLLTNLNVAKIFTGCNFSIEGKDGKALVKISPKV